MAIDIINKQRLLKINRRTFSELARATQQSLAQIDHLHRADAQLSIVFVRDPKMRQLNRLYRGKDYATDVLSFQSGGEPHAAGDFVDENYLGDIVISTDTALRQAQAAGLSVEREIQELIIHGILHLNGYDHETDNGEMHRLELQLRKRLLKKSGVWSLESGV
ncbi:MAG: rRNA maturation RNase YbeY [Acidobacteriota bacterium]